MILPLVGIAYLAIMVIAAGGDYPLERTISTVQW